MLYVLMFSAASLVASSNPGALAPALSVRSVALATAPITALELKVTLNNLLSEHVWLASAATGAALQSRKADFDAAAAQLDRNSVDLSKAIGIVYGNGAETAFLGLWRKHIGMVVDYTTGLATKDKQKQDKAVNDLLGYTQEFGAFLAGANPNLPKDVVAGLVKEHVLTLKNVIDAQAAKSPARAYEAMRSAAGHMSMIANPLADAIAKQFPARFAM